ncbi:MAG TPA: peptide-methionine (R)-S-oxide reductase MsrB [Azospirillaceae bacterium]|nr:peptide-methionine (R)-S-oxide reductase MsrB [Azospirillaceae bacterium]
MISRHSLLAGLLGGTVLALAGRAPAAGGRRDFPLSLSDEEWRRRLSPEAFQVLRRGASERPGSSPLYREERAGTYHCAACGQVAFDARTKYASGTGWPSFWTHLPDAVVTEPHKGFFRDSGDVFCANCGGQLGEVFSDGPRPTGLRYCMNGIALTFAPAQG